MIAFFHTGDCNIGYFLTSWPETPIKALRMNLLLYSGRTEKEEALR